MNDTILKDSIMKTFQYMSLFMVLTVFFLFTITTKSIATSGPAEEQSQLTVLEELSAQLHKNGRFVEIEGAIKNISKSTLKGYVTVYLLGINGEVINAKDKVVGQGLEFSHGMVTKFKLTMKVAKKKRIDTISVDFIQE